MWTHLICFMKIIKTKQQSAHSTPKTAKTGETLVVSTSSCGHNTAFITSAAMPQPFPNMFPAYTLPSNTCYPFTSLLIEFHIDTMLLLEEEPRSIKHQFKRHKDNCVIINNVGHFDDISIVDSLSGSN